MNDYRIKKERERLLYSSIIVLLSTTIIFATLWLIGLLKFEDFNDYSGPVKITFGVTDGVEDLEVPVKKIPPKETVIPENESVDVSEEIEVKKSEPEVVEKETRKIEEPVEVKKPDPKKVEEDKKKPEEAVPRVQKGSESGNSHETTFESTSSNIGRRAYIPISLYMPLPKNISKDIFANISGDVTGFGEEGYNRNYFLKHYRDSGAEFRLDESIPYDDRPYIWTIIEEAGYDTDKAEYKISKKLKPVIISFVIKGNSKGNSAIKSAVIDSSSGDTDIDESVLYGFKKSTYSNSTDDDVKGRFKYSFK